MKNVAELFFLLIPVLIFGQQNEAKTFTNSVDLKSSPETVWNAITDFSNFNLWDDNVIAVRCSDGIEKNNSCQVILKSGKIFDVKIIEAEENVSYTIRYQLSSGNVYIKRHLEVEGTPRLTETVWYKGVSKRTFEKYKGPDYGALLEARMLDFKKYLEEDLAEGR